MPKKVGRYVCILIQNRRVELLKNLGSYFSDDEIGPTDLAALGLSYLNIDHNKCSEVIKCLQ